MSYKDGLTAAKTISRKTGADGVWFTDNILSIQDNNLRYLAGALDDAGLVDLNDIAKKAELGAIAYDVIQANDLPGLAKQAEDSRNVADAVQQWTAVFPSIEESATFGKQAYDKVKNLNLANLQTSAENGNLAWTEVSALSLAGISASAMQGASTSATIASIVKLSGVTPELIQKLSLEAGSAYSAWTVLSNNRAQWDEQFSAVNASAAKWNAAYDAVSKSANDWNSLLDVEASASYWNDNDWRKMNTMLSVVSSNSANWSATLISANVFNAMLDNTSTTAWNATTEACDFEKWNDATEKVSAGSAKWNIASNPEIAAKWDSVYETVNTHSGRWDRMQAGADNWNSMYETTNANAYKWNTMKNLVSGNSDKWNAVASTTITNSGNWNTMYISASKYKDMYDVVNTAVPNFNTMYKQISDSATNWDANADYAVDKTKIPIQQAYTTVLENSAIWNAMKNIVEEISGNWNTMFEYANVTGTDLTDTTLIVADNYSNWNRVANLVIRRNWYESQFWLSANDKLILKTDTVKSASLVQTSAFDMNAYKSNPGRIIFIEV